MAKHLKILGREADASILDDVERLKQFVLSLIEAVGMTTLAPPQIYRVELEVHKLNREPFEDEGGISCLACLSTSHVAIHTWPLRTEFHLDVYSCRSFDPQPILHLIRELLQPHDIQVTDLSTSCEWKQAISDMAEANHVLAQSGHECTPATRIRFGSL